ncbi:origin recognition complex subunit 2 [Ancylostoma duodenale]|uniref:Origin recognition complex subunit 2 n=1 Tax=Ancylostoma duodenale TaxID=51022 RepID=A0A0C2GUB8_9BILA|nr:origin recognition complex subunit 2 [Ancylostoma duodenale]
MRHPILEKIISEFRVMKSPLRIKNRSKKSERTSHGGPIVWQLYGVGSKRALVSAFRDEQLSKFRTLVIDGFREDVTSRSILVNIVECIQLKDCEQKRRSLVDWAKHIACTIEKKKLQLIILLNNIDSPNLRDPSDQAVLATLAANPAVLMLATVDHINATLLWTNAHSLSSLDVLWQSLATNSRSIFRLFYAMFFANNEPVAFWDLFSAAK